MARHAAPPFVRLTEAELRSAWSERRRADWPATFETTMDQPIYAAIVRIHARHLLRNGAAAAPAVRPAVLRPEPPAAAGVPRLLPTPAARGVDLKRLAAGDRDDLED